VLPAKALKVRIKETIMAAKRSSKKTTPKQSAPPLAPESAVSEALVQRDTQKRKWYYEPAVILLACIFFFPVGLALLWSNKDWTGLVGSKAGRIIISVFLGLIVLISFSNRPDKANRMKTTIPSTGDCEKAMEALGDDLSPANKTKLFQIAASRAFERPHPAAKVELLVESQLDRAYCYYASLGEQAPLSMHQAMFHLLVRARRYDHANGLAQAQGLTSYAAKEYLVIANQELMLYQKSRTTDHHFKLAQELRDQAIMFAAEPTSVEAIDKKIEYLRPVGSGREAYSLCKEAVKNRLHDPDSAEFEYSGLELMAAGALLGTGCDVVTDKICVIKFDSWVRATNAFGAIRKTPFHCEVTFLKPEGSGTVTKLSL